MKKSSKPMKNVPEKVAMKVTIKARPVKMVAEKSVEALEKPHRVPGKLHSYRYK